MKKFLSIALLSSLYLIIEAGPIQVSEQAMLTQTFNVPPRECWGARGSNQYIMNTPECQEALKKQREASKQILS